MYKFCYHCGGPTDTVMSDEITYWKCQTCHQTYFNNPKPGTEAVLFDSDGRVAIAVRSREPYKGKYDLPGGFVDAEETLEQGIARELKEELGLDSTDYSPLVYLTSAQADYPWGRETYSVVSASFVGKLKDGVELTPSDDVEKILMVSPADLKPEDFAWPAQHDLILKALAVIK